MQPGFSCSESLVTAVTIQSGITSGVVRSYPGQRPRAARAISNRVLGVVQEGLLRRNIQRFRGGLVFKAHSLVHHSTLGLSVIKKRRRVPHGGDGGEREGNSVSSLLTTYWSESTLSS